MLTNFLERQHIGPPHGQGFGRDPGTLTRHPGGTPRASSLALVLLTALALGPLQLHAAYAAETGELSKPEAAPASPDEDFGADPPPPADLVVLARKNTLRGRWRLGVYDRQPDPLQSKVWRLKLWEQTEDRVFVSTDVLNCSPTQPMRITGGSAGSTGVMILRDLNPGGPITPANRLDHQVWWAACFPEHTGKDPATLGPEARRLGFSGSLVEREEVVPGPRRP